MAGTPADIARDTKRYEEAGLNHIVFDLRFRYADWYQQIDLLGQEVLPAVRACKRARPFKSFKTFRTDSDDLNA